MGLGRGRRHEPPPGASGRLPRCCPWVVPEQVGPLILLEVVFHGEPSELLELPSCGAGREGEQRISGTCLRPGGLANHEPSPLFPDGATEGSHRLHQSRHSQLLRPVARSISQVDPGRSLSSGLSSAAGPLLEVATRTPNLFPPELNVVQPLAPPSYASR